MKISLNGLVELLTAMVGKPFSVPFQEQLKTVFNYKRADWMQKVIAAHPNQRKYFLKHIAIDLVEVDEAECPVNIGCKVLRTSKPIPLPLRTDEYFFDYVGDPDKMSAYTYVLPDQLWVINHYSRYTKHRARYVYINGYIYIYNADEQEFIDIGGVWPDQRQLNDFKCDNVPCYTDEDQYEIPDDIINTMVQDVFKNELRIMTGQVGEVTIDQQPLKPKQ